MLSAWKEILQAEADIIMKYRARGKSVIRLSSVLLGLFAIMYLFSDIDLIPERIIQPSLFAYIDDMVIALFAAYFVYKDVEEVFVREQDKVSSRKISAPKRLVSQDEVPVDVGPGGGSADNVVADAGSDAGVRDDEPDLISGGVDRLIANSPTVDKLRDEQVSGGDTGGTFDLDAFFNSGENAGSDTGDAAPDDKCKTDALRDFFK